MKKIVRITTVPQSLDKLLDGQLKYMSKSFDIIAISSSGDSLNKVAEKQGVKTYSINMTRKITVLKDIIAVLKLLFFLIKQKPDIVHSHTPKAGIVGMTAAFLARVPIRIHTVAGLPLLICNGRKRKLLEFIEKITYLFSTKIYPNSYGLKDIIINLNLAKSQKLKVIGNGSSNGIDINYFSKEQIKKNNILKLKEKYNIRDDDFVYLYVGRIVKDKGINELVETFLEVNKTLSNTKLLLVGDFDNDLNPIDNITMKIISSCSNIILTGYQNDVRIYFALSDLFVFPSHREGFPNVVMQAGAMEIPSIVTNINGCNEIIINNYNGKIINPKDSKALYASMIEMFQNDIMRRKFSINARINIKKKYTQTYVWEEILKEYKSLLCIQNF